MHFKVHNNNNECIYTLANYVIDGTLVQVTPSIHRTLAAGSVIMHFGWRRTINNWRVGKHPWLRQCKPYSNDIRFSPVIIEIKLPRFHGPQYIHYKHVIHLLWPRTSTKKTS